MARTTFGARLLALALAALSLAPLAPRAGQPSSDPVLLQTVRALQSCIDRERYADGLEVARSALRQYPRYADFQYGEALCLAGLHRYREAAERLDTLANRHTDRHDYRLKLAECLFLSGRTKEALTEWGRFLNDPVSGDEAYVRTVQALLATGQEERARELIREGLERLPAPSRGLLRYQLDLERSAPAALAIVSRLRPLDPTGEFGYDALSALYQAAGDLTLFDEAPLPNDAGVTIPLEHFTDTRDSTGMGLGTSEIFMYRESAQPILTCPVSVNGAPSEWMMLDSGSPLVFLSPQLADRLGVKALSETQYGGLGESGLQDSAWVLLQELKVGPFTVRNVPAVLLNRKSDFWSVTPGIIPLSLFRRHALLYNPDGHSLTLLPSGTDPETLLPGGTRVPSLWFKGCPFVQTRVQGSEDLFLLADTGSYNTLLGRTLGSQITVLNSAADVPYPYRSGLSGSFSFSEARDVRLCLARECTRLSSVQVTTLGLQYGLPLPGILGRTFLDRYSVFFDSQRNVIVVRPLRH